MDKTKAMELSKKQLKTLIKEQEKICDFLTKGHEDALVIYHYYQDESGKAYERKFMLEDCLKVKDEEKKEEK